MQEPVTARPTPEGNQTHNVDPLTVTRRLQREGRWAEIEPLRNEMMKACRGKGMSKIDAQAWTYSELDRMYPPLEVKGRPASPEPAKWDNVPSDSGLRGMHDVPNSWPELPAGSSLQAELQWVQSNRLAVVEEKSPGVTVVHLGRAHEPAPSRAALGWLETSIRAYSKYVDVVARTLKDEQDEAETIRRERMAIDEIRDLLQEMHSPD